MTKSSFQEEDVAIAFYFVDLHIERRYIDVDIDRSRTYSTVATFKKRQ